MICWYCFFWALSFTQKGLLGMRWWNSMAKSKAFWGLFFSRLLNKGNTYLFGVAFFGRENWKKRRRFGSSRAQQTQGMQQNGASNDLGLCNRSEDPWSHTSFLSSKCSPPKSLSFEPKTYPWLPSAHAAIPRSSILGCSGGEWGEERILLGWCVGRSFGCLLAFWISRGAKTCESYNMQF